MIAWDDRLATGLSDVDIQHQQLFEIVNHLAALYRSGATSEQLFSILSELKQYTITHFQTEETLMTRYPVSTTHCESHLRAHQEFILNIHRTSALAATNPDATVNLLLAFLSQWLLHHVANMDQLMASEILALQSGLSPQQVAREREAHKDALVENINAVYHNLGERTFQMLELNLQLQSEIERRKQVEQELVESKARFRTVADHTHSWEYWQGTDGQIIYMSPSCERVTGHTAAEFMADPELLYRIIHPEDRHLMENHRHSINHEEQGEDEVGFRIMRQCGEVRWIVHACKALSDTDGQFIGRRGSNRDITDRRMQNDSMLLIATVFDAVNEAVLLTDEDNRIIVVNSSFTSITGYSPEEIIGQEPGFLEETTPAPERVRKLWETLTANTRWQGETTYRHKNGNTFAAAVSIDSVRDDKGLVTNFVLVFSDVSERKANEQRIHYLANFDQLTGLPNWGLFCDRLQQALSVAKHNQNLLALIFVDIDHFKASKDKLGHDICDLLLKEVARRISECLSGADTAARIGTDEFVILLPAIESAQKAEEIANKVLLKLGQPFVLNQHNERISASIGIAIYPEHGANAEQLLRNVDLAVYQAKQTGGAMVLTYSDPGGWLHRFRATRAPD